ncbi:MAG: hypothetical protein OXC30_04205 [Alphaproteobacteria bacterium]|nr:hypothetical protein [Alphaproteobacteria bacterium]
MLIMFCRLRVLLLCAFVLHSADEKRMDAPLLRVNCSQTIDMAEFQSYPSQNSLKSEYDKSQRLVCLRQDGLQDAVNADMRSRDLDLRSVLNRLRSVNGGDVDDMECPDSGRVAIAHTEVVGDSRNSCFQGNAIDSVGKVCTVQEFQVYRFGQKKRKILHLLKDNAERKRNVGELM